ncbi:hypothetical protein [Jejuia pallidilutea]|uniref:Uncharacterized protein n=1 Tax=Jejuia pallidilutea TaxID=504487 RepID=A0A090VMB1_9FLAO|nr:hypothetical protein [Jejuia pallidilutea]GAL65856.1 hypothetical protein JCM19301_3541 [Jejuia pallidilutea]GAL71485.1 hypothetical protein JCM19302_1654 [Jejuia pallidilutea]GAL88503.1 hypothetical protein JCM19538_3016 [Jejuia pallidilutea]
MKLQIINTAIANDFKGFVDSWSKLYSFSNEAIYRASISKKTLTKNDIQNLYEWKNGMRLSKPKQKSVDDKIKAKLSIINDFKNNDALDLEAFKKEFKKLTAVWKIFLLHIIKPTKYPIYDQHIHRTFLFINKEEWSNISNTSISNKAKEQFYFERYLPFIASQNIKDIKQLDEAFFAFGQFLNTRNYASLLQ